MLTLLSDVEGWLLVSVFLQLRRTLIKDTERQRLSEGRLHHKDLCILVSTTSGALIDLDYAKHTSVMTVPLGGMHTISFDAVQAFTSLARLLNHDITEDVVTQCLRLLPDPYDVFSYVAQATKRNVRNSKPNGSWSAKDFGWEDIVR